MAQKFFVLMNVYGQPWALELFTTKEDAKKWLIDGLKPLNQHPSDSKITVVECKLIPVKSKNLVDLS